MILNYIPRYPARFYLGLTVILEIVFSFLCSANLSAQEFVPFPISTTIYPGSHIIYPTQTITTATPRLIADGDKFSRNGDRIKLWGTNLTFGCNFPAKSYAPILAKRLGNAGINCVRLHHLDYFNYPSGIWNSSGTALSTTALDLLDYFIAQLANNGVYINLNLHVSRKHSSYLGLPDPGTDFDKVVDIFTPSIITAQQGYATSILTHVNPYRGMRYADDPEIAIIEISNEDSLFMWDGDYRLRNLPAYYATLLKNQYNSWLTAKYGTTSALSTAWMTGIDTTGPNLFLNPTMQNTTSSGAIQNWIMETHSPANAVASTYYRAPYNGAKLQITSCDSTNWHLQFKQVYLTVQSTHYYTLSFMACADTARTMDISVMQDHDPWSGLGLWGSASLTTTWSSYTFGFVATATDTNTRVSFSIGASPASIYLANMNFHLGGQIGIQPGEFIESTTVSVYTTNEATPRIRDRLRFLAQTEKAFYDSMRFYVRDTIGSDALVTGTIVFGPLGLYGQSDMDFIDAHAYWQHPQFPGTAWDPNNWYILQEAMTDYPSIWDTFSGLASNRLAGKPFTVTEYNHPAPNDFQQECVPMISSFASAQDWDGVWLFDYGNATSYNTETAKFSGFFDCYMNSAKFGFVPAGASLFRNSALPPLTASSTIRLVTSSDPLFDLIELERNYGDNLNTVLNSAYGIAWDTPIATKLAVSISTGTIDLGFSGRGDSSSRPNIGRSIASPLPEPINLNANSFSGLTLSWTTANGRGFYYALANGVAAYTGHSTDFAIKTFGQITVISPNFAAITITPLDTDSIDSAQYVLLTACGRCENTGMVFSTDRTTVGSNWGHAPVQIEAVDAQIKLPSGNWTCQALSSNGAPSTTVPVSGSSGTQSVHINSSYNTMWYLLTRTNSTTSVTNFFLFK
ncbi:MAG: carbohydrate binding domain-containing protein [bacterium]